jgi:spore coat protein CotH
MSWTRLLERLSIAAFLLLIVIVSAIATTSGQPDPLTREDPRIEVYAYAMPHQGWAPLTVAFSAYGSRGPNQRLTRYEWDLNGDGRFETDASGSRGYAQTTFFKPGTHTVSLRVTDDLGRSNLASTVVQVRHPASSNVDYWTLFDDSRVRRIDLIVSQANWDLMWVDPVDKREVPADAVIFGERVENVGLSMKGNASLDASGDKKPWKLDINAYEIGQEFQNLNMLLLHNNFADPSMLREKMGYDMLRFAGVPASLTAFVEVWIDIADDDLPAEYWGLYTMVERPDRKFLANRFGWGNDSGNLYKADAWFEQGAADLAYYGPDIQNYPMPRGRIAYRKMSNEEEADYSDIIGLCKVIDGVDYENPESFAAALEEVFDVDVFLRYMAATFLHLNLDTYPYTGNNYYLYHDPGSDKFVWIAWDLNSAWGHFGGGPDFPLYGAKESLGPLENAPLFRKVFEVEEYRRTYRAYMDLLVRFWFSDQQFRPRAKAWHDLLAPYVRQGTGDKMVYGQSAMFTPEAFDDGWVALADLTRVRSVFIRQALAQIES